MTDRKDLPQHDQRASRAARTTAPAPVPEGGPTSIITDAARHALATLRRRWLPALAVFLFVMAAVVWYTWRQPVIYTATANLVVNARVIDVNPAEKGVVPDTSDSDSAVNTEVQILQSHEVAQRVADALSRRIPHFAERITGQSAPRAQEIVANVLQGKLAVRRPGNTNVLSVAYSASEPELAAAVANAFGTQYLSVKSGTRLGAAQAAQSDIAKELETMRVQVEEAEAAVARYKAANNLLSAEGSTLTEQEVSLYRQQEATANTTLAEDRARLNTARQQLRRGSTGGDVGEALGSQVVGGLRQQKAQLSAKVAEMRTRYKDGYPDLEKAKRQLADVDQAIQDEIRRVISNLEAKVSVSAQRAATARAILGGAQGQLVANNTASVRLGELQRRADALKLTYQAMMARRNAVTSEAMIGTEDARVFSPAQVPENPSSPNRKLNLVIGLMLACLLAGMVVALLQMFDRGIATSRDAERLLGLRHLANWPLVRSIATRADRGIEPADFAIERPLSMVAEAARNILVAAERSNGQGGSHAGRKTIAITSSRPDECKTTLAISLARISAQGGRRTLLVDGDIRRARVGPRLGIAPQAGLVEVMEGRAALKDAVVLDERSGCWVLPAIAQTYTAAQFGVAERFDELLDMLVPLYDTIIVDTPPVLAAAESRAILQTADTVIFAVRWNRTLLPVVRAALKRLRDVDVEPAGVVLTMVDMRAIARFGIDDVDYNYKAYKNYGYS